MRLLKWLGGGAGLRAGILLALVPTAFVAGLAYFRRSRSVPPVIVVCCVDARYSIYPRLAAALPAGYRWQWPGCAKEFVDRTEQRERFFEQLHGLRARLAKKGVWIKTMILVDHQDCAWYDDADSAENHRSYLHQAAKFIREDSRTKDLSVGLYLHDLENNRLALVESEEELEANVFQALPVS